MREQEETVTIWVMEQDLCDNCGALLGYFGECPECGYDLFPDDEDGEREEENCDNEEKPDYPTLSSRPLLTGESILPFDNIQISHGASWTWGLYSDHANRSWYICYQQIVQAVFPYDQMREATQEYGRMQRDEPIHRP